MPHAIFPRLPAFWMLGVMTLAASSMPPPAAAGEVAIPDAEQFALTASANGRRYRIFLLRPRDPAPPAGYPVIYLLDGNATFATGAEAVRLQTRKPKGFEPAALVAIGYETDEPFDVERRFFDYTTPAVPEKLPPRKNGEPWPSLGGADAFLHFIKHDLFPEIERRIDVDSSRRTLFGHSLGGFFVLDTFLRDTNAFSTYVAGSPSVWWNGAEVLHAARSFVAQSRDIAGKRLMIAIGGGEHDDMLDGSRAMAGILAPLSERGIELRYVEFESEEHVTVLPAVISRTVTFSLSPRSGTGQ